MPQRICTLCADKINDFFEFREMCAATNVQTRKLLNLPDQVKVVPVKQQPAVESIFGIDGIDIKPEAEPARGKKAKKTATVTSVGAKAAPPAKNARAPKHAANESLACTAEDMDSGGLLTVLATARDARGKVAKAKGGKKEQAAALLAPKPLNQRERKREIQQKKDDRLVGCMLVDCLFLPRIRAHIHQVYCFAFAESVRRTRRQRQRRCRRKG